MSAQKRFHLYGDVQEEKTLYKVLKFLNRCEPGDELEFVITSFGGNPDIANGIYSALDAVSVHGGGGVHVTTVVRGIAASAASLITQAGDVRVCGRLDCLHLHEASMSVQGQQQSRLRDLLDGVDLWLALYADVMLSRSEMSRRQFFENLVGHEWTLYGQEAFEWGFVDAVR